MSDVLFAQPGDGKVTQLDGSTRRVVLSLPELMLVEFTFDHHRQHATVGVLPPALRDAQFAQRVARGLDRLAADEEHEQIRIPDRAAHAVVVFRTRLQIVAVEDPGIATAAPSPIPMPVVTP